MSVTYKPLAPSVIKLSIPGPSSMAAVFFYLHAGLKVTLIKIFIALAADVTVSVIATFVKISSPVCPTKRF